MGRKSCRSVSLLTQLRFYVHIRNVRGWRANSMNFQGQRDLLLLSEVERDGAVTQRSLSTKLGVALGLTNLYLKRLARKGYIKITTIPSHRARYLLTPQGLPRNPDWPTSLWSIPCLTTVIYARGYEKRSLTQPTTERNASSSMEPVNLLRWPICRSEKYI